MMHDKLAHVCDIAVATIASVASVCVTTYIGVVRPYNVEDQLWQTILPMLGSILTALGAFWLNPQEETRKIVAGRVTFALMIGTAAPSILIAITPNLIPDSWGWVVEIMRWPGGLILIGAAVAFVAFVMSRPWCESSYKRAGALADAKVKQLAEMAKGPHNTVIVLDPSKIKPEPPL